MATLTNSTRSEVFQFRATAEERQLLDELSVELSIPRAAVIRLAMQGRLEALRRHVQANADPSGLADVS